MLSGPRQLGEEFFTAFFRDRAPRPDAADADAATCLREAEAAFSQGDWAEVAGALARLYPRDELLPLLPALAKFAVTPNCPMPRVAGRQAAFVSSIAAAKNFWLGHDMQRRRFHRIGKRTIGVDLDFLGAWLPEEEWGAVRALNFLVLNRIQPTRRAAVVGTMRDDGIYALEWIAHHLTLGFEGIFVYTNDNADGSEHLLRRLAEHGVITLVESETAGGVRPELKAFEHATNLLHELRDFEWVLFVDSDEFLQLGPRYANRIEAVLDDVAVMPDGERPSAIVYEWLWCNSGMVFERTPGLLMERFPYASPHWVTKSLVRLGDLISMRRQHVPDLRQGCAMVDSMFGPMDAELAAQRRPPQYGGGRINHYWPKSFEEFSLKKARGDSLFLDEIENRTEYHRGFRHFFEWNAPDSPETYQPSDPAFLADVNHTAARLRALDGVAALEAAVEARFAGLLARYDKDGGLRDIYDRYAAQVTEHSLPED